MVCVCFYAYQHRDVAMQHFNLYESILANLESQTLMHCRNPQLFLYYECHLKFNLIRFLLFTTEANCFTILVQSVFLVAAGLHFGC